MKANTLSPICGLIFAVFPLEPALAAVFGADERRTVPTRFQPMTLSIGAVLTQSSKDGCSAFCVADRLVATAAHCLVGKDLNQTAIIFNNAGRKQTSSPVAGFEAGQAAGHVVMGMSRLATEPPLNVASDWALVRLEKPVCRGRALPVFDVTGLSTFSKGRLNDIFLLGIHGDFRRGEVSYSGPCTGVVPRKFQPDFSSAQRVMLHDCDAGPGASGGPLMYNGPRGISVVGIHNGVFSQRRADQSAKALWNTGTWSKSFRTIISAIRSLRILTEQDDINKLRVRLRKRGFDDLAATGPFDETLKAAIASYQAEKKLPVTGLPDRFLLRRLR